MPIPYVDGRTLVPDLSQSLRLALGLAQQQRDERNQEQINAAIDQAIQAPQDQQMEALGRIAKLDMNAARGIAGILQTRDERMLGQLQREADDAVRQSTYLLGIDDQTMRMKEMARLVGERQSRGQDVSKLVEIANLPPDEQNLRLRQMVIKGTDAQQLAKSALAPMGAAKYSNIKRTADGGLVGLNEATGEYERMALPEGVDLEEPKSQVEVNVDTRQETEYAKSFGRESGKIDAQGLSDTRAGAAAARSELANLTRLEGLLKQVNTGKFSGTAQGVKQTAKAMGINLEDYGVTDDTAPAQAAQALSAQMALEMRNPAGGAGMPGAMSDKDREFLQSMVPGIENTAGGIKTMVETRRRLAKRRIAEAKIVRQYYAKNGSLFGVEDELQRHADANPMFDDLEAPQVRTAPGGSSVGGAKVIDWSEIPQ